jgi:hypothetical protein
VIERGKHTEEELETYIGFELVDDFGSESIEGAIVHQR